LGTDSLNAHQLDMVLLYLVKGKKVISPRMQPLQVGGV
jgi:hypothetical protein